MRLLLVTVFLCLAANGQNSSGPLGDFEGQTDIGNVLHPGSAEYDPAAKTYAVTGSGENMWFATDEFHYVWKKITAKDVTLTANISILTAEGINHRKGVLMFRQTLDSDSAYVDVARHGDGLTSLQYREDKGAITREVESNVSGPSKVRIEKQGDLFYMWVSGPSGGDLEFAGGSAHVVLHPPFYVGIGVTAHDKNAIAKVAFQDVVLENAVHHPRAKYSTVETVIRSGDARTGYVSTKHLTDAGWSADGHALTFKVDGHQDQVPFTPLSTAAPVGPPAPPDKTVVAFLSEVKGEKGEVALCLRSLADQQVKTLTVFQGGRESLGSAPWSPDGRRLVFISYQDMK